MPTNAKCIVIHSLARGTLSRGALIFLLPNPLPHFTRSANAHLILNQSNQKRRKIHQHKPMDKILAMLYAWVDVHECSARCTYPCFALSIITLPSQPTQVVVPRDEREHTRVCPWFFVPRFILDTYILSSHTTMYAARSDSATFGGKHVSAQQQEVPSMGDGPQQPEGADPVQKPGVSTRSGLASGASRRALGDITNNRSGNTGAGGKQGQQQQNVSKPTTRAALAAAVAAGSSSITGSSSSSLGGLASAAPVPVLHQQSAAALPHLEEESRRRQQEVEDMDLIQEVDEIDMHIEEDNEMVRNNEEIGEEGEGE